MAYTKNTPTKKVFKNPINFHINLSEEQKEAEKVIRANKITVLRGAAGSGKTALAAKVALEMLFHKEVERIVVARATVTAGEEIGFMPGGIDSKLAPYTAPLLENMYSLCNQEKIDKMIHEKQIEVIPVGFMRGRNLKDAVVVIDESQNITDSQMQLILGRLCKGSKMILCGDIAQCDLKSKDLSGFEFICNELRSIPDFEVVTLNENHRDPIVEEILAKYENKNRNV